MHTLARAIQTHEVSSINPTTEQPIQNIDVEHNLLTLLDALAATLVVPDDASDTEACLLIAKHIKAIT